jgi:hypothetical protein
MLTCSCPCAHHEDIWERGVTTPHIIKPVLLHNMPRDNIRPTISSMITFLLHNISLAIKWNKCLFHSLHILVSLFLWVMIFGQTYPHSLALSGTLVLHEYEVSLKIHPLYLCGKCPEYQLNRRLDGPVEYLDPARNFTSITHSSMQATACQPHQLHYHSYPYTVRVILNICCNRLDSSHFSYVTVVTDCLFSGHF